jgi:hypothetical protein
MGIGQDRIGQDRIGVKTGKGIGFRLRNGIGMDRSGVGTEWKYDQEKGWEWDRSRMGENGWSGGERGRRGTGNHREREGKLRGCREGERREEISRRGRVKVKSYKGEKTDAKRERERQRERE